MTMKKQQIRTAFEILAGTHLKSIPEMVYCAVQSVNEDDQTCDCIPINGDAATLIPAVKLTAEQNDGFLLIPKVESTVVVMYGKDSEPFVALFSDIDKIVMIADTSIQMNDGLMGGIVKVIELTTKINRLEADLNTLKAAFNSWVIVPSDGGAALKTAAAAWSGAAIPITLRNEIENPKITHGS